MAIDSPPKNCKIPPPVIDKDITIFVKKGLYNHIKNVLFLEIRL